MVVVYKIRDTYRFYTGLEPFFVFSQCEILQMWIVYFTLCLSKNFVYLLNIPDPSLYVHIYFEQQLATEHFLSQYLIYFPTLPKPTTYLRVIDFFFIYYTDNNNQVKQKKRKVLVLTKCRKLYFSRLYFEKIGKNVKWKMSVIFKKNVHIW